MNAAIKKMVRQGVLVGFTIALFACGGGGSGDGGGGGGTTSTGDEVLDSLNALGVNTEVSPRLDDDFDALPDDYSPFGSAQSFDTIEEVLLIGPQFDNATQQLTLFELQSQNDRPIYQREDFFTPAQSATPWAASVGAAPDNLRVAAAADLDGDGLDEIIVVYREGAQGSIMLLTYQESVQAGIINFTEDQSLLLSSETITDLAVTTGDLNGDGLFEIVVGLSGTSGAQLLFIDNTSGALQLSAQSKSLPQAVTGSLVQLSLATGNLDYDAGQELVAVVNERFQASGNEAGASRYFIIDDANAGFADVRDNLIRAVLSQVNRTAVVADVSTGDIDGDNVDEVIFAGLQNFDPNGTCGYRYLMVALDDIKRANVALGGLDLVPSIHGGCNGAAPGELRFVHVNTLDLDGDGLPEIQANQYVFDDFVNADPWSQYVWGLDANDQPLHAVIDNASLFASAGGGFTGRFDIDNSAMMAGDATADGRQNIMFYSQATNRLETWGLSNPDAGDPPLSEPIFDRDWRMMNAQTMSAPGSEPVRPLLVASNVNHDSLALRFSEGDYQLVFTEPVIIAALAAAPCNPTLSQNTDACRTSYGTAQSTSVSTEDVLSIRASATVGFEAEFSPLGVKATGIEVLATLQARASLIRSSAYTVTKRIVYTTGPIEDTVILTTIPLDQYTYTITSHPDPELIGSKVVISLPREPIEIQVERSRYNANVVAGGPEIGSNIFQHTPGNPSSYMSSSEKDALLGTYFGYEIGPQTVGNSGGSSEASINVSTESGFGVGYGVDFDLSVKATAATVVAGFSVGFSADHSLQIIHGQESEYIGSVADMNLSTAEYGQNRYDWGLFTYVYDDPVSTQQFEVINYWVQ